MELSRFTCSMSAVSAPLNSSSSLAVISAARDALAMHPMRAIIPLPSTAVRLMVLIPTRVEVLLDVAGRQSIKLFNRSEEHSF